MAETNPKGRPEPDGHAPRLSAWGLLRATMRRGGSSGWLICTIVQALLTWGLIWVSRASAGYPWANLAKLLVVFAILATWGMAMRAIHARLVELLRSWQQSMAIKAGARGLKTIPRELLRRQEAYIRRSMLNLRIIAAGITMPVFVLPLFTAVLCVALTYGRNYEGLLGMATVSGVLCVAVAAFFRWSILAVPAGARVRATAPRNFAVRFPKRASLLDD